MGATGVAPSLSRPWAAPTRCRYFLHSPDRCALMFIAMAWPWWFMTVLPVMLVDVKLYSAVPVVPSLQTSVKLALPGDCFRSLA